jgi:tetratricopeptide (TPR) repeat protein
MLRRRYPVASYGFLVYMLLLAPTSSFVPIQDPIAERRLYLAMIGLLFVVVDITRRIPVKRNTLALALASILVVAGVLTYQRNRAWSSDVALWEDTVQKSPRKARAHFQLAYAYQFTAGRCELAIPHYEEVARLQRPTYDLLVDWGEAYACAGRVDDALAKLRQAAALEPGAHVYFEIATVCANNKRFGEALEAFDMAEKLDPNYVMTYVNRGGVYRAIGDARRAVDNYRRALALDPGNSLALKGLAEAEPLIRRER